MDSFTVFEGLVAPLDRVNVDTDQIIPKQFLRKITRSGYGPDLFAGWRYSGGTTTPDPAFVLNLPRYAGATILLARANFGCGSSREHAPWALHDYGFRAIVAPSYTDIFYNNCFSNGILPVVLPEAAVEALFMKTEAMPGYRLTVNLPDQEVITPDGTRYAFRVGAFQKNCLLRGLDSIGWTLQFEDSIAGFERQHHVV
jgi:3-isopropylmalate/(R)-2-methylmalate dehydratase small subunit